MTLRISTGPSVTVRHGDTTFTCTPADGWEVIVDCQTKGGCRLSVRPVAQAVCAPAENSGAPTGARGNADDPDLCLMHPDGEHSWHCLSARTGAAGRSCGLCGRVEWHNPEARL